MIQKTFQGKRPVLVKIETDFIIFFFVEEVERHERWLKEMEENYDEVQDFEKEPSSFYDIPVNDWVKDKTERLDREDNWHIHMKEKRWFTSDIEKFINDNTAK